jgi:predicted dehydrogenase
VTRLLVAGGGLIGSRHIAFALDHPKIDLVGVIDPDPDVRATFPVAGFATLDAVDVKADGIIIATPTDLHADHAETAAKRGWHMLIEKPIASHVEQADRIIVAAERAGVHVLVGHHRRYHPQVQKLKALLDDKRIGTPVLASMIWSMKKPDAYFDVSWRAGREGSPIMINLVHEVDLLRYLFGDTVHVSGFGSGTLRNQNRIESGVVTLGFADGPTASDWSEAAQPTVVSCASGVPLVLQMEHFCDVIAGQTMPLIDARDGRETLLATLAIETALGVR